MFCDINRLVQISDIFHRFHRSIDRFFLNMLSYRFFWCSYLTVYLFIHPSIHLSIYLPIHLSLYLSLSQFWFISEIIFAFKFTSIVVVIFLFIFIFICMFMSTTIFIFLFIFIICYHRSSVNIALGNSRLELTKPGDQSMAGFDFKNNTIKSGDRSMAGLDPIEVYISKWIIKLWYDFMFSIWFYPNIVIIWCFQYDFTSTLWCIWSSRII